MGIPLSPHGTMADDDALTTVRMDSVLSALNHSLMRNGATGMGTALDPYTQVEVGYGRLLNEQQLRALYRGSWFIRRVVDLLPMDMTKAGVEVELHDGSNARIVNKAMQLYHDGGQRDNPYEKRIGCNEARRLALTYARWFGMGYIVLRVNGGENPAKTLTKVKSFEGVSVLDRYSLRPAIGTIDVHNPEYYQISRHDAPGGFGGELSVMQRIHASRVLVYKGARIHPYDIQLEGDGGHDSVVQQVYEAFTRHFMAKDAISKGLDSYSLFKVAISGLSTLLQSPNGTQTLTEYLNTVAQQMSMHRIIVQDTEASKSEFQERSFAGVAENFKFFVDDLIAATGYPHYKIYGSVGKAGLADSGGAESRAWAETVNAYQSMELADNDRILFHAIFEALGRVPKQWEVTYPSIYSSTPEEDATLAKTQADTLSLLTREGIITTRQAYQALATGQPLENVLEPLADEDVLTPVEEEAAQGPSAEEELAALLGGAAPTETEVPTEAPADDAPVEPAAEDAPEDVAIDEPLPDVVDAPIEDDGEPEDVAVDAPAEDDGAIDVPAETVPEDEVEPASAEDEMAALLAEEEQQTDAADTYTPPQAAQGNARKVLEWRDKYGDEVKGMTRVGWTRASQLASGDPISLDTVKRMAQFNRHRKNSEVAPEYKDTPWKDAGHVAWLGWGGTTGIDWAMGISSRADDLHEDSAEYELEVLLGWRSDKAKGGKGGKKKRTEKPKCTKGRSCGMSCIPQNRKCKSDLSPAADVVAKSVAASGGGGTGGGQGQGQTPQAAPQAPKPQAPKPQAPPKAPPKAPPQAPQPVAAQPPQNYKIPSRSFVQKNFKFLGKGGYGSVYLDPATGIAVKFHNIQGKTAMGQQEYDLSKKAGDLGVGAKMLGRNNEAVAMEFLANRKTFSDVAALQELGLDGQKQLAKNFFSQLEKLHANGISHGDVSINNIMYDPETLDVRIIDYGLARESAKRVGGRDLSWIRQSFGAEARSLFEPGSSSFQPVRHPAVDEILQTAKNGINAADVPAFYQRIYTAIDNIQELPTFDFGTEEEDFYGYF